jgi:hypothetical protein
MADIRDAGFQQLIEDSVDYLMSGPGGLGQNFSGISSYTPAYLTGTYRAPFTVPIDTVPPPQLTVPYIAITNITVVNINPVTGESRHILVEFAAQPAPPFVQGRTATVYDVDPDFYNGDYVFGVVTCSTTSVLLQTRIPYTWPAYVSGGFIGEEWIDSDGIGYEIDTDCLGTVTVTGPTDIVFVSAQLNEIDVTYTCTVPSEFQIRVTIERYKAFPPFFPNDPDLVYDFSGTVSQQIQTFSVAASGSVVTTPAIFTTVLDSPSFGLYRYYLAVYFEDVSDPPVGDATPDTIAVGLRSLTAQVIKQ